MTVVCSYCLLLLLLLLCNYDQPPREHITDIEELSSYQGRKRKEFEDSIRKQRQHIGTWIKYAKWEADQGKMDY